MKKSKTESLKRYFEMTNAAFIFANSISRSYGKDSSDLYVQLRLLHEMGLSEVCKDKTSTKVMSAIMDKMESLTKNK